MGGWLGVAPRGPGRAWLTLALNTVTLPLRPRHNSQSSRAALTRSRATGHPKAPDSDTLGQHPGPSRHHLTAYSGAGP